MTMDERIEAAARAYDPAAFNSFYGDEPALASRRALARYHASKMVPAAVPELSGDKPTHFIASFITTPTTTTLPGTTVNDLHGKPTAKSARDAYLGKGDGG